MTALLAIGLCIIAALVRRELRQFNIEPYHRAPPTPYFGGTDSPDDFSRALTGPRLVKG